MTGVCDARVIRAPLNDARVAKHRSFLRQWFLRCPLLQPAAKDHSPRSASRHLLLLRLPILLSVPEDSSIWSQAGAIGMRLEAGIELGSDQLGTSKRRQVSNTVASASTCCTLWELCAEGGVEMCLEPWEAAGPSEVAVSHWFQKLAAGPTKSIGRPRPARTCEPKQEWPPLPLVSVSTASRRRVIKDDEIAAAETWFKIDRLRKHRQARFSPTTARCGSGTLHGRVPFGPMELILSEAIAARPPTSARKGDLSCRTILEPSRQFPWAQPKLQLTRRYAW